MANSFHDLKSLTIGSSERGTENNRFALFLICTAGLSVFNTFLLLFNAVSTNNIANRPLPTMVQTVNGKTLEMTALEGKNRSPQFIKEFTAITLTRLFTWSRYFQPTSAEDARRPKIDPGVPIESKTAKVLVPTNVWAASFTLASKFREEFLGETVAPLLSKLGVTQGQSEVSISILDVQDPIEVKGNADERLWKVKVIANLILRAADNMPERTIPFNKTIYLQAIYPASSQAATASDLAHVVAMAHASGLQIYAIEKYDAQDTKPAIVVPTVTAPATVPPQSVK